MRFPPRAFNCFIVILMLLCLPQQVKAAETAQANYVFYAGGLSVMNASLDITTPEENRYKISFDTRTRGMLDKILSWQGLFETYGWRDKNSFLPEQHQSIAIFRGEKETKTYRYKKDGAFEKYTIKEHDKPLEDKTPDRALTDQTTDILSAAAELMTQIKANGSCDHVSEIFDGKRRYRLIFEKVADVQLEASRYNIYSGPAVECTAMIEPLAGKWHEKPRGWASIQAQGLKKGKLPTVWFATGPSMAMSLPVKARVFTDYGAMFMHMVE
jgi:hypothetical protein